LRSVLKESGYAVIGTGEGLPKSNGTSRAAVALENAIKSPLLDADLTTAGRALVNIVGGENMTLREAESVFQEVSQRIKGDALLKWGARIDPDMQRDSLKVMLVVSGVAFPEYSEAGLLKTIKENEDLDLDELFESEEPKDTRRR
jgi:cell division protein FtsZ